MQLNELQRTEYLTALGVTSYMPRFRLPLAPEPRQALLPRDLGLGTRDSGKAEPGASADPTTDVSAKLADLGILDAVITESRAHSPEPRTESPESRPPDTPAEVKPFVLSCWWLGEELLAIDSREPGGALPVESLFDNIVRALGWHQLPRERERHHWPLAENRFGPAAAASDARDTFSVWLEAACARKPVKSIWLMGRQARNFCAPIQLSQPVSDWNGVCILAMPSLTQLLQQPSRKRELWQLLQNTYPEQTRV